MELKSAVKSFGGWTKKFTHASNACGCTMTLSIYFPPQAKEGAKVPIVYYLSGLTCTDDNVITKGGAQRVCAALGLALVAPDTSPRGLGIEGEDDSYDFGSGAGFYLNATESKWSKYRMYDYVVDELPALLKQTQPLLDTDKQSIFGHSMGGHGALTIGLRNSQQYQSISAFAPISNPMKVPWGIKAFSGYLGDDSSTWAQYDACELAKGYDGAQRSVLIDQGDADNFLAEQLAPDAFLAAVKGRPLQVEYRVQEGYDHSYYFIATFMEDHLRFHAKHLGL